MGMPWKEVIAMILMSVKMCLMSDSHFAMISSLKPCAVDVAHQYRWLCITFNRSFSLSQSLSLLALATFFVLDLAICQMSKLCIMSGCCSQSHFAMSTCWSEVNSGPGTPASKRYCRHLFAPLSSIAVLLPT